MFQIPSSSKRLSIASDNYDRPEKTITDLTQNKTAIEEQLKDFEEISDEDLNFVNVNTQLKYLSYDIKNRRELFRFGGLLVKVNKEYLLLAGKEGKRFSAQRYTRDDKNKIIHTTRFFKKMKDTDLLKEKYEESFVQTEELVKKQNDIIEKQRKELMALKKKLGNTK
jgi:hypothetical protein